MFDVLFTLLLVRGEESLGEVKGVAGWRAFVPTNVFEGLGGCGKK